MHVNSKNICFDPTIHYAGPQFTNAILKYSKKSPGEFELEQQKPCKVSLFHYLGKIWRWCFQPSTRMDRVRSVMLSSGLKKIEAETLLANKMNRLNTLKSNLRCFDEHVIGKHNQRRWKVLKLLHLAGINLEKKKGDYDRLDAMMARVIQQMGDSTRPSGSQGTPPLDDDEDLSEPVKRVIDAFVCAAKGKKIPQEICNGLPEFKPEYFSMLSTDKSAVSSFRKCKDSGEDMKKLSKHIENLLKDTDEPDHLDVTEGLRLIVKAYELQIVPAFFSEMEKSECPITLESFEQGFIGLKEGENFAFYQPKALEEYFQTEFKKSKPEVVSGEFEMNDPSQIRRKLTLARERDSTTVNLGGQNYKVEGLKCASQEMIEFVADWKKFVASFEKKQPTYL